MPDKLDMAQRARAPAGILFTLKTCTDEYTQMDLIEIARKNTRHDVDSPATGRTVALHGGSFAQFEGDKVRSEGSTMTGRTCLSS